MTAGVADLRHYDLRQTFATRFVERGVQHYLISALLGRSAPLTGFGLASRVTPDYAHTLLGGRGGREPHAPARAD